MEKEISKEYEKGDFTIVWKPKTCIHAATCVKTLPEVYDPNAKPWIKPENGSIEALKAQIDQCPSGALSYYVKGAAVAEVPNDVQETLVDVKPNGPLLVHGTLQITDQDGKDHKKERTTAFCRCGASNNKPFCDGQHSKVGFIG